MQKDESSDKKSGSDAVGIRAMAATATAMRPAWNAGIAGSAATPCRMLAYDALMCVALGRAIGTIDPAGRAGGLIRAGLRAGHGDEVELELAATALREMFPDGYVPQASRALMALHSAGTREWRRGGHGWSYAFDAFDAALASTVSDAVAAVVAHAEMSSARLRQSVADMLVRILGYKDEYTMAHTVRVGAFASLLADRVPGIVREGDLELGVRLHDIGKIGVRGVILSSPHPLSDDEFAAIRSHPVIGADILSGFDAGSAIVEAALLHHERWDGRGYPLGLAGEDIPVLARVICVADAFDAMTSSRPYRPKAMSVDAAMSEILAGRGSQFDADMAVEFAAIDEALIAAAIEVKNHPNRGGGC